MHQSPSRSLPMLSRRSFSAAGVAALCAAAGLSVFRPLSAQADEAAAVETVSIDGKLQTEFPIVIEHACGQTVVESAPERVVCLSWNNMEPPLALGVAPVGYSKPNYGAVEEDSGTWPWVADAYEELGAEAPVLFDDTDGFDLEAINDCEPDIILAAYSGMTQEDYGALSKIAPVVAFPKVAWQTFWREQTMVEGTALGLAQEAKALVEEVDELIAQKVEEYGVAGHKGAVIMANSGDLGTFYIYLATDPRGAYLIDLGAELPQSVLDLAQDESADSFALTLSAEQADQFDDLEFVVMYGDEALLAEIQADALLGSIPAIAKGAAVMLPYESNLGAACNPSVLGIKATIDEYLGLIAEALEKASA